MSRNRDESVDQTEHGGLARIGPADENYLRVMRELLESRAAANKLFKLKVDVRDPRGGVASRNEADVFIGEIDSRFDQR